MDAGGLGAGGAIRVTTAQHLATLDEQALRAAARRTNVFARVSPAQKLQIVQALQASGFVVGMTGDSVNDAPALAAADVGITIGTTPGDASVVADVLLTGDRPEDLILRALAEGRGIRQSVRKSLRFLLSTNLSELLVMIAGILAGNPATLSPRQLLWINLLSDVAPSLALAMDPADGNVLRQRPDDVHADVFERTSLERMLTDGGILSGAALAAYYFGLRGGGNAHANSLAFLTLTCSQLLHAFSCRSDARPQGRDEGAPANPVLAASVEASIGVQVIAAVSPSLRRLMHLTPLGLLDGAVVATGAVGTLVLNRHLRESASPISTNDHVERPAISRLPKRAGAACRHGHR